MKEKFTFQQKTKLLTKLFDAGCTLVNSCGDTVASMVVTRVLYGKDWYKKNLNKQREENAVETAD